MIERCGWSSACASVSWPLRRISSTSEWSRVSRSSLPRRRRYARLSPTWPIATSSAPSSRIAAVVVVPIPARFGSVRASLWIERLAPSIVCFSTRSGGPVGSSRSNDSTDVFEATSPAWAPPIPSAMTKTGARTKTESSLALRCRPVSVA